MLKRILAAVVAVLMIMAFAVGCKPKDNGETSSKKKPTSSQVDVSSDEEEESSEIADDEGDEWEDYSSEITEEEEPEEEEEDMSGYDWTLNTSSAFYRDTEEAKQKK